MELNFTSITENFEKSNVIITQTHDDKANNQIQTEPGQETIDLHNNIEFMDVHLDPFIKKENAASDDNVEDFIGQVCSLNEAVVKKEEPEDAIETPCENE